MNYEMIEMTNQLAVAHWGWTIALFLWLVGLSGMGLFVNMWTRNRLVFLVCTVAGIAGTLLVVSHLGRMLNLPVAVFYSLIEWEFNFTSWMFIGICILAVLCVWTALQAIVMLGWIKCEKCSALLENDWMYRINGMIGLAATAYSGFLLTQATGIPLWNTAMVPTIWIVSGFSCALGLVEFLVGIDKIPYSSVPWITKTSNIADSLEGLAIFAFVLIALSGEHAARAGAEMMIYGSGALMFWVGAVLMAIVLPIFINLTFAKRSHKANIIGGASAMIGALCLRASVLFAGFYAPILWG